MTTQLVLRSIKGSPLTNDEMDTNFANLRSTADTALTTATNVPIPPATISELGGIKVGAGLSIDVAGVLAANVPTQYSLPIAAGAVLGGIKVGSGLSIDGAGILTPDLDTLFAGAGKQLLNVNGYQRLPGGLIIQWGKSSTSVSNSNAAINVTFPISFPTQCLAVIPGGQDTTNTSPYSQMAVKLYSMNTTGAVFNADLVDVGVHNGGIYAVYVAIGY